MKDLEGHAKDLSYSTARRELPEQGDLQFRRTLAAM